jgi:antitoxin MazE
MAGREERLPASAKRCIFIVDTRGGPMKTRVQKWGNSLALRIPKAFAAEAGLREGAPVELSVEDGVLVVRPLPPGPRTLDDLLRGVTDQNRHGEWDTGPAVGGEVW